MGMGRQARINPKPPENDDNIKALLRREDDTPNILNKSQTEALRKARANARRERKAGKC